jgi:hypothetical protein
MARRKQWSLEMNEIRNILALLSKEFYSARETASALSISHQSVGRYLKRISDAGLSANEAVALGDEELSKLCGTKRPGPVPGQLAFIDDPVVMMHSYEGFCLKKVAKK